jgi:hypothetical protein
VDCTLSKGRLSVSVNHSLTSCQAFESPVDGPGWASESPQWSTI